MIFAASCHSILSATSALRPRVCSLWTPAALAGAIFYVLHHIVVITTSIW